eukprot:jgi/Picsp_1/1814/NSC_05281-R1_peptidyl-prolyl cis-trans isomerase
MLFGAKISINQTNYCSCPNLSKFGNKAKGCTVHRFDGDRCMFKRRIEIVNCHDSDCREVETFGLSSRRDIVLNSLLALSLLSQAEKVNPAFAGEGYSESVKKRAFFDVAIDGQPEGRVVIESVSGPNNQVGAQRFLDLAQGIEGVGYRRSKITLLQDNYISGGGLKALSYKASERTLISGGNNVEVLEDELNSSGRKHDVAGLVSINVRPRKELETKDKLVAVKGKFVSVTEQFGEIPNGTEFSITTGPAPELDSTNLVIGRVVEGMDVVERLSRLPRVKDNTNSPFFQAGKRAGDRRASVAEKSFGKPFSKITVTNCGIED